MPVENGAESRGFGGQPAPLPASSQVAQKMELETLSAEMIETKRKLAHQRQRIRILGGHDPASEASLP